MTGVVYSVRNWLSNSPPTIAMPSGRRNSDPVPVPMASGRAPSRAAIVVIMIGRNRNRQAWRMASSGDMPCWRSASSAKSTIMIAFFLTMPMSRMIPISEIRSSGMPNSISASNAPTPADGRVDRIVIGWMKLS